MWDTSRTFKEMQTHLGSNGNGAKKKKKERRVVVLRRRAKRMRLHAFRVHMLCSSLKLKKVHIPHSREEFKGLLLLAFIFKASLKSLRLILNSRSALHYFCNTHFY